VPFIRPFHGRLATLLLTLLTAVWLLLPAPRAEAATAGEKQVRQMINHERATHGKDSLGMMGRLVTIARRHSREMANNQALYHNDDLGSELSSLNPKRWGENVGRGQSLKTLHDLFMNSSPHRKNILKGAYDRVGVGVVVRDGVTYVTVVFVAV
jgi:uncharacterized protein YkwD